MEKIRILMVEDDVIIGANLQNNLEDFGYTVTGNCTNSDEALISFKEDEPDLLVLDIDLGESKLDGVQIAEKLNVENPKPIIYLTSYTDKKTINRAQRTKPAYFLVKPSSKRQIKIAIDLAFSNFSTNTPAEPNITNNEHTDNPGYVFLYNNFFFVKHKNQFVRISIDNILWVKADGASVEIHTATSKAVTFANLSSFERQIKHPNLIRIHRSYVVNKDKVIAFGDKNLSIPYQNTIKKIPIGGRYRDDLMDEFPTLRSD